MSTKVISNKRVSVFAGPEVAIDDWEEASLADLQDLINVSGAINWDSFDFNLESSEQGDDRTLTDEAGSQSRQFDQFGGSIQLVYPKPDDTTSIYRIARDIFKTGATKLAVAVRTVTLNSAGISTGDEINLYHVQTNIPSNGKNDVSHFYDVALLPRDDVAVNYIVPAASPTATVLTPSAAVSSAATGDIGFITAVYQGRNTTIGSEWESSLPNVVEVDQHGIWRALSVGGPALVTARSKGGLVSTAKSITVTT
jgi:hypothetical protein